MGIDVGIVQKLLNELIDIGAQYVVVADVEGLSIAFATVKEDTETIETMGAVTSLVIPQGEQLSNYLGGNFLDTVIHTKSASERKSILAYSLDTDPKTAILMICEPELEPQVVHQFEKMRDKIEHSLEGIAVEVRDNVKDPFSSASKVEKRIEAFWETLVNSVQKSTSNKGLQRDLLDAKDNYMQIHGRFSPVLYKMKSHASKISKSEDFDAIKEETLKLVNEWRKGALQSEKSENQIEESDSINKD